MHKLNAFLAAALLIAGVVALYEHITYTSIKSELDRRESECPQPSMRVLTAEELTDPNLFAPCGPTFEDRAPMHQAEDIRNSAIAFALGTATIWLVIFLVRAPEVQKGAKVGGRLAVDAGRVAVDELSKRSARATKEVVGAVAQLSDSAQGRTRECPFCAEMIKPQAKVCRHCGKDVA
jgi:hypothetical protein